MSGKPSIRGNVFAPAMEDLRKLVSQGVVSREGLGRWLGPSDLELLDEDLFETEWYDVRTYGHVLAALRDLEGGSRDDYLRNRGVRSAERLLNAGLHAQMQYLSRIEAKNFSDPEERFRVFGHDLKLLTTLSAAILNFAKWGSRPDPDQRLRYLIEITDASAYPDPLALTTEGFTNRMAREHDGHDLWRIQRVRPDVLVMKMIREL